MLTSVLLSILESMSGVVEPGSWKPAPSTPHPPHHTLNTTPSTFMPEPSTNNQGNVSHAASFSFGSGKEVVEAQVQGHLAHMK